MALAASSGCSAVASLPSDAYQAEADAAIALTFAAIPDLTVEAAEPEPKPKPSGVCTACSGTGKSGDGIGRCGTCGGDGRIDPDDVLQSITEPYAGATVELRANNTNARIWATDWWKTVRPIVSAQGVTVKFVEDKHPKAHLKICGKTCIILDGPAQPKQVLEICREVLK